MLGNSAPKNPKNWKHSSLPHIFWWVTQEKKQTCRFILVSTELCIWGSYNIALHCNNFHNKLQKNLGKCDQYHETNASVRSTVGICFHVEYTKRAWLHLLQSHSRDISFRLFQFKHQLLSQSDFSPTDPPIHFHKLNLPNSFDLHENTLSYICTVQPSAERNHFSSRMRLPLHFWFGFIQWNTWSPLQNTVFTVPSRYSLLLSCAEWISLWPSLKNTSLSLYLLSWKK